MDSLPSYPTPLVFQLPPIGPTPSDPVEHLKECAAQFHECIEHSGASMERAMAAEELSVALRRAMIAAREPLKQRAGVSDEQLRAYGPKFGNLTRMGMVQNVLKTPGFAVPPPVGPSSSQVESFLEKCAPEALQDWKELGLLYDRYLEQGDKTQPFLKLSEAKQKTREIQATIIAAFHQAAEKPEVYAKLGEIPGLKALIASLRETGDYAVVRSTGAEDTQGAANAGGNVTVQYVPPTEPDILCAVGTVVASYFARASLKNRLDVGQNPFREPLQLAVAVQHLISEPVIKPEAPAAPPEKVCSPFVCFSSEPLYIGTEHFRVMRISATRGHGEGVVGGKGVANDYWLILHSDTHPHRLYAIPDIKKKRVRLAPVAQADGTVKLEKVKNSKEIAKAPALSQAQLRSIFSNAVIMEAFFGDKATDIEGVCRGDMTYFVQARPRNTPELQAYYFDTTGHEEAVIGSVQANPLVPGRANVVEISNRDQVVVAETLEQALKLYKKGQHWLVVVSRPSPLLSHAVVNFSYLGMPCLYTRDSAAVNKLMSGISPNKVLEVCTQTATLHLWDRTVATDPSVCTKEGFGKHPAKISPSPLSTSLRVEKARETPEEIRVLLLRMRGAKSRQAGLAALQELQEHPLIAGIHMVNQQQTQLLSQQTHTSVKTREVVRALSEYDAAVTETFKQATAVFSRSSQLAETEDRLLRLFHAEALEAMLLEPLEEPGAVGRCSLMQVERMSQTTTELISYQRTLGDTPAQFADLLMEVSRIPNPDPALFHQWKQFLLDLEAGAKSGEITPAQVTQFNAQMKILRKAGVLPFFFMFFNLETAVQDDEVMQDFESEPLLVGGDHSQKVKAPPTRNGYDPKDCVNSSSSTAVSRFNQRPGETAQAKLQLLLAQFTPDASLITELSDRRTRIKQLQEQMDQFAHPKTFEQAWTELEQEVRVWSSAEFLNWIKSASPLTQNIAFQTMERLVTTLDTACKTMKIGPGFKDDAVTQTRLFKRMLMPYHHLMAEWALRMIPQGAIPTYTGWEIPNYVAAVKKILINISDEDAAQLLPSANFSVNSALLGSKTQFHYVRPVTLEDVLTLQHQNLLVFLSVLNLRSLPNALTTSNLPKELTQIVTSIEEAGKPNIKRVGLSVTENEVLYRANYTMREHSAQIQLVYKKETQKVSMRVQFTGTSIWDRWSKVADWVKVLDESEVLRLTGSVDVIGGNEVSFAWDVNLANIPQAMAQFFEMAEFSMGKIESITLPVESPLFDGLLNKALEETPENILMVRKFLHYASTRATRKLLNDFIEKASRDTTPRWVMKHIPPADLQNTAKKLFEDNKAEQGLKVLEVAYKTCQIGDDDFEARLREHIHKMPSAVQSKVMRWPWQTTLPSQADLASEDLWTRLTALYCLKRLVKKKDPEALILVQPALQRLLTPPESFSSLTPVFRQAWEIILCHLVDTNIIVQEMGQILSVLAKARCKPEESTIFLLERLWKQSPTQQNGETVVALFAILGNSELVTTNFSILVEIAKNGFGAMQLADAVIAAENGDDEYYQFSLGILLDKLLKALIEQDADIAFAKEIAELLKNPLHTEGEARKCASNVH